MSDIKVSHGWTFVGDTGLPIATAMRTDYRRGEDRPCVLVWLKDFNALATDAMRWRSHLIIAAKEKRLAEISANFEEIRRGVEALYPSVGENASETTPIPGPSLAERFPVGRMARVTHGDRCVGRSGPITSTVENSVWLYIDGGGVIGFNPDRIELLPEAPAPAPWVPKVGERVLVVHLQAVGKVTKMAGPAHALVDIDGVVRGYCIENLRPAPTDPAPAEPSKAAFAAWKHRVPVVGERVRALTPSRHGQLGTVNAPAKFDNDADRHGQVVIVSAKMDTGEVVVNGIQWWEPAEPSDGVSLVTDAAMDEMRRKLAAVEKERDEARAKLSLAQVAESFLDSRMTRIRTTLDRVFPAIEEAAQGPRVLEPWEQIERIAKERDEARADFESLKSDLGTLGRLDDLAALRAGRLEREAREFERAVFNDVHRDLLRRNESPVLALRDALRNAAEARAAMFPKERSDEK